MRSFFFLRGEEQEGGASNYPWQNPNKMAWPFKDLSIIRALIVLLGDDCPDASHAAVTCISQLVEPAGNVIVTQERGFRKDGMTRCQDS